jgi:hypothetical protein
VRSNNEKLTVSGSYRQDNSKNITENSNNNEEECNNMNYYQQNNIFRRNEELRNDINNANTCNSDQSNEDHLDNNIYNFICSNDKNHINNVNVKIFSKHNIKNNDKTDLYNKSLNKNSIGDCSVGADGFKDNKYTINIKNNSEDEILIFNNQYNYIDGNENESNKRYISITGIYTNDSNVSNGSFKSGYNILNDPRNSENGLSIPPINNSYGSYECEYNIINDTKNYKNDNIGILFINNENNRCIVDDGIVKDTKNFKDYIGDSSIKNKNNDYNTNDSSYKSEYCITSNLKNSENEFNFLYNNNFKDGHITTPFNNNEYDDCIFRNNSQKFEHRITNNLKFTGNDTNVIQTDDYRNEYISISSTNSGENEKDISVVESYNSTHEGVDIAINSKCSYNYINNSSNEVINSHYNTDNRSYPSIDNSLMYTSGPNHNYENYNDIDVHKTQSKTPRISENYNKEYINNNENNNSGSKDNKHSYKANFENGNRNSSWEEDFGNIKLFYIRSRAYFLSGNVKSKRHFFENLLDKKDPSVRPLKRYKCCPLIKMFSA